MKKVYNSIILLFVAIVLVPQILKTEGIMGGKKIKIVNLKEIINHENVDYAPTVSADGKTLYYVSDKQGSVLGESDEPSHDFWVAKKNDRLDTVFLQPFNLDPTGGTDAVNTMFHEGAASIAADKQSLYFTACDRPGGLGSCDIYKTTIDGDKWSKPFNLGKFVNSKNFDTQPTITADQSRIYFVSTRKGPNSNGEDEYENYDIWYSDYDFDLEDWNQAVNLEAINTPTTDASPFIGADGVTLFFASEGHLPNLGGLDFYRSELNLADGTWSKVESLGAPINTEHDEQFISLPASGDIIYFSSTREDIEGYQGGLDIFMAFVPSFFKAVNVKGTVTDECSGDFIPAEITVYNPITDKIILKDSVTYAKPEFEKILSNDAYGNPADSIKIINLEITAKNDKYGTKKIIQRIEKPEATQDESEEGAVAIEYDVKISLGQQPNIISDVAESEYVKAHSKDAKWSGFNGLVMKETRTWDLYPLLNYVFFDVGSSAIPDRYITLTKEYTAGFNDTTIEGGTLDKYYHVLNIYGYRLNQFPDEKITLVGCNDNVTIEEKKKKNTLSKDRATIVRDYLRDVWSISEDRMKIVFRDFPKTKSNPKDSMGWQENRRVELLCDNWEVTKPVFEVGSVITPQPVNMEYILTNGIEDGLIASRRIEITKDGQPWNTITDIGITEPSVNWNWQNKDDDYPDSEGKFEIKMIISTKSGAECSSEPIEIPIRLAMTEDREIASGTHEGDAVEYTDEKYSLILFKFNSYDPGKLNDRIMSDYVYNRIQKSTKMQIIGHTDVIGLDKTNLKLSKNRANSVVKAINRKTKKKYESLDSKGVGEEDPLYTNDLPEGRFYNRTVQVLIQTPLNDTK